MVMRKFNEIQAASTSSPTRRQEIEANILKLESMGTRCLWGVALFLAISIAAQLEFPFLPPLSPEWRRILGPPPPVGLINGGLFLYSFSGALLALSKMMNHSLPGGTLIPVAYLAAFYTFYALAGALSDHFWAVFASGVMVLGLESYHVWTYRSEQLREERRRLTLFDVLNRD